MRGWEELQNEDQYDDCHSCFEECKYNYYDNLEYFSGTNRL